MKVVNTDEKTFISSERFEKFKLIYQERCDSLDNIKSRKYRGLLPLYVRYIFGKTTGRKRRAN